jgi:hypothetical protein
VALLVRVDVEIAQGGNGGGDRYANCRSGKIKTRLPTSRLQIQRIGGCTRQYTISRVRHGSLTMLNMKYVLNARADIHQEEQ